MTLIETRPGADPGRAGSAGSAGPAAPPLEPDGPPAESPAEAAIETGSAALLRSLVVLLLIAVAVTALWKAFNQVVAPGWYRTHQHHLAADLAQPRPGLEPGQAAGVVQIPGIGANLVVIEGSDPNELRGAPGHRTGTPLLAKKGNSIIEGHRDRWGAPFGDLDKLVERTRIVAMNRSGIPIEYRVTTVKTVKRAQLARYLAPSSDYRITLITQAGGSFSTDRLVVQAVAGTPSKAKGKGEVPALDPPGGSALPALLALVLGTVGAIAAYVGLRRDHRAWSVAMVVVPLVIGAVLALLLLVDGTLPPLL
ncbi:sortase [Aquihabitans sp. McL0605]|uniref:sortase n=1 Tax=Aquihabitans sp. McL0605 TaxID=3415671 RepID=UPI003CE912E1